MRTSDTMHRFASIAVATLAPAALVACAAADVSFVDAFEPDAATEWQNEWGSWIAVDGEYIAQNPDNFPSARSSLPFEVVNFTLEFDVGDVSDGGVWLRSTSVRSSPIGVKGVLLVTKGSSLYWHVVPTGESYGAILGLATDVFAAGSDPHLRVEVCGSTYQAFVNGSSTPATTLVDDSFVVGRVALYDFGGQSFDNVVLEAPTIGDLDGDGVVGGSDLGAILAAWGPCAPTGPCDADLTCDGVVDGADLGTVLGAWSA